jgi:hypothetical protein
LPLQPEQAAHVIDQIGQPDLGCRSGDADGATTKPILAFCSAKTCSTWARTFDFLPFALVVRAGIGRSFGFFRWIRLTSIRSRSNASFFFEW